MHKSNFACDVNLLDVSPFVSLLMNDQFDCQADLNDDFEDNLLDVAPFIDILVGG